MFKNIAIILNPVSGNLGKRKGAVDDVCASLSGISTKSETLFTSGRGKATELARKAVGKGSDLVVAIGGDGTINEVASGLVGTDVPLGIIPMGSGNGLARSLGIPLNIMKACDLIRENHVFGIDVCRANKRYFFLVAGFGFDALVGKKFDEFNQRGALSYFYISVKEFWGYRPELHKIKFDDHCLEVMPFVVAAANGQQYGNNAIIAPKAKLDDGLLDICIVPKMNAFQVLSCMPRLFNGKIETMPGVQFYRSSEITVERSSPGVLNLDGEPVMEDAVVKISVLPQKLQVIASNSSLCLS